MIKQGCFMKKIFIFLFILSSPLFASGDHDLSDFFEMSPKNRIVQLNYQNYHLEMLDLRSKDLEILGVNLKDKTIDLFLTDKEFQDLSLGGYHLISKQESALLLSPDAEYKSPEEIYAFLKEINDSYPEITHLISIGKSVEGRDIWAIKISDNASLDEKEPSILFNSMHHAREVMTPEVAIDIVEYLVKNYKIEDKVTHWIESKEIWVIPMLNVDGNQKVWGGSSMWRKNVRGGYGVDINRNYPYKWGSCNGSSASRFSDTFRGDSGGSEPETQALMNFVEKVRPVFDISFHSYSELVIYPYGCKGSRTPTAEIVEGIGKKIASLVQYTPGTSWETLYSVDGGDIDWMYSAFGVIPYVLEVNSSREGFQPNFKLWRDKTVTHVRKAWMYLLERMDQSMLVGHIYGKKGNLNILIFKDKTLFQTIRPTSLGEFYAILNPGKYSVILKDASGLTMQEEKIEITNRPLYLQF